MTIISSYPPQPDYLSFVDDDIAAIFKDKGGFYLTDILLAQLIKEIRKMNNQEPREPIDKLYTDVTHG